MKKKTKKIDKDFPIGKTKVIDDFLPSPEDLFSKALDKKILLAIDEKTVKSFKQYASFHNMKYQKMIREVLQEYAKRFLITNVGQK